MFERRKGFTRAALRFAAALLLAQLAAHSAHARRQTPPPRRPSGPAASAPIKLPRGAGAEAEQPAAKEQDGRPTEQPKWEYCAILGFTRHQKGYSFSQPVYIPAAVIRFFSNNGGDSVEGETEDDALAGAFTRLGDDGWELTAVGTRLNLNEGNGQANSVYFFKRVKRAQPEQQQQ